MKVDTLILGAGAAGMYCAGRLSGRTLVIDHASTPGEKIRISGGGRCNFTNLDMRPENFHGENPHFHKSALSRHTQWDFIDLVDRHNIPWTEKTLGQLFTTSTSKAIIEMLRAEMQSTGADLWLETEVVEVSHDGNYQVTLRSEGRENKVEARALVLATGGKSIPKMGATGLAYKLAAQFGMRLVETRPALVPFTLSDTPFAELSGVSVPVRATAGGVGFEEAMLFTHRGLSGPAILQASSYWRPGDAVDLSLAPDVDMMTILREQRAKAGKVPLSKAMAAHLPSRLLSHLDVGGTPIAALSDAALAQEVERVTHWHLKPTDTEGYRKAEVTAGGVSTDDLDSKTMMSKTQNGLFVIGEAVDVTGWLGGYNFQWAWSSAAAAADAINAPSGKP